MNPDVAKAVPELVRRGILSEDKASATLRIARGELVSVYLEIRLLFYFGVLLITAGVGLLVEQNYRNIGPLVLAIALGVAALALLAWVADKAPPFSWGETESPSIGFDYILLLGVMLATTDLAVIEVQFTPLGASWPWHLLIVSIFMAIIAVRYDSRTVFSLALSTFAAWRGLSVSLIEKPLWFASAESVRWNAIACGILFILLGRTLLQQRRKPHFEPVAVHLGWFLVLAAMVSGGPQHGALGIGYIIMLAAAASFLARSAIRARRFGLFAFGIFSLYIAMTELVFKAGLEFELEMLWVALTSLILIFLLWKAQRKLKDSA